MKKQDRRTGSQMMADSDEISEILGATDADEFEKSYAINTFITLDNRKRIKELEGRVTKIETILQGVKVAVGIAMGSGIGYLLGN